MVRPEEGAGTENHKRAAEKERRHMVSKLIVIRHGITEGNEKRWFYGKTDLPLLKRGRETLLEYKRAGVYPEIPDDAQCVVSGLARTRETMDLLYERSECVEIEKLQEMNFGVFECRSFDDLKEDTEFQRWVYDERGNVCPPGGETRNDFSKRVKDGLKELIGLHRLKEWSHRHGGEDAVTVMVCHGGVISAIMQELFPEEKSGMWDWIPDPGLGYVVDFSAGEPAAYDRLKLPLAVEAH